MASVEPVAGVMPPELNEQSGVPRLQGILQRCGLSPDSCSASAVSAEDQVRYAVCAEQLAYWLAMRGDQRGVSAMARETGAGAQQAREAALQQPSGSCLTSRLSWKRRSGTPPPARQQGCSH